MTIKDILVLLKKYDPDSELVLSNHYWGYDSATSVKEVYVNWKSAREGDNGGEHGENTPGLPSIPVVVIQ